MNQWFLYVRIAICRTNFSDKRKIVDMKFANKTHPRILCRKAFLSAAAAFALLFAPTSGAAAGADLPQDDVRANLAPETGAERTDLRAHQDNTRCVTQAATTTGYSRLVTRGEAHAPETAAAPARHLSRVMHAWPVTQEDGGATLLFSDSPRPRLHTREEIVNTF